jgi:flagellar biosynthesis protein FlhF
MGTGGLSSPALQDSFEQLLLNGVDKRFAIPLLKKVAFEMGEGNLNDTDAVLDHVAAEMMTSTEVFSLLDGVLPRNLTAGADSTSHSAGPVLISLVGPTGVGKTTTVAKMASEALLKRNLKVGLINLDSYKVAAFDQLATYAKILNVPFRSAGSADDLAAAVQDFKNLDVVFIDTTGRSQRDPESLREMQAVLSRVSPQSHLVVSATTRDLELYDIANRFSVFKPQGLVVSKLDEATTYGALYNVSQRSKLPLAYFTTGQRVPEDIEEATRERMVALIMNI